MKEIKEEIKREVVDTHIYYEATDGTRFDTMDECRKYEQSALGVMRGKIAKMIVSDKKDAWELMGGCDDHQVIAISICSQKDVDTFLQWYYLECPWYLDDSSKERRNTIERIVREAYTEGDVILVGISSDNDYYFINSRNNIVANLNVLGKEEVK